MVERLFVYGTLMDSDIQEKVFGRKIKGIPDILYGYRPGTVTFGNVTYPAIRRNNSPDERVDREVKGIVLTLSDEDLMNADIYEGEYYRRTEVTLKSGIQAYVYEVDDTCSQMSV